MRLRDIFKNTMRLAGTKIVVGRPPVWDNVCAAFKVNPVNAVFTYGDTIYNPGGLRIDGPLLAHERLHMEQQGHSNEGAAIWWGKYLRDPKFRLDQEARAYAVQYTEICKSVEDDKDRHEVMQRLGDILSGPLYGRCIGKGEAIQLVRELCGL